MMLQLPLQKFTCLILMAVIFAASALNPCLESGAAETPGGSQLQKFQVQDQADDDHCPNCPERSHPESDDCASSCGCLCHLPASMQSIRITHSPVITEIVFFEPFTALPEVYLSKFIPPQNFT